MGNRSKKMKGNYKPNSKPKPSPSVVESAIKEDGSSVPNEPTTTPAPVGDTRSQMCHYVPQWVLRHFREESDHQKEKSRQDCIWCYSAETGKLEKTLIAKSYAEKDLFKDVQNPLNIDVWAIENKIGDLENHASKSVGIILAAIKKNSKGKRKGKEKTASISLARKWLTNLRKFMFVMQYHQLSIAGTYWDENHPDNSQIRSWIQAYRERENLSVFPRDVWLHVLKYYLSTPHEEIIKQGNQAMMKHIFFEDSKGFSPDNGSQDLKALNSKPVSPDLEHWEAVSYATKFSDFFLAIWEAAPGSEFIMSNNSFGLYEGKKDPLGPIHRLYIVSPQIVLALCHVILKPAGTNWFPMGMRIAPEHLDMSMLLDAPHDPAKVTYVSPEMQQPGFNFRGVVHSEEDIFEFPISTLSEKDTQTVNAIILGNVRANGVVTFRTKAAALKALDAFGDNREFDQELRFKFMPLAQELLKDVADATSFRVERFTPLMNSSPGGPRAVGSQHPLSIPQPALFRCIQESFSPTPGMLWETHYRLYRMVHDGHKSGDPYSAEYIEYETKILKALRPFWVHYPGLPDLGEDAKRPARLVEKMDDVLARALFTDFGNLMVSIGVKMYMSLFREQVIIGLLNWLLENYRGVINDLENHASVQLPQPVKIMEYIDTPGEEPLDERDLEVMTEVLLDIKPGPIYIGRKLTLSEDNLLRDPPVKIEQRSNGAHGGMPVSRTGTGRDYTKPLWVVKFVFVSVLICYGLYVSYAGQLDI